MDVLPDFQLSEAKARVGTWIADKLNTSMSEAAAHYHWTFVEAHRRDFIGRGICAGTDYDGANIADDLRLPRKTAEGWRPYNPADFKAYASRQRWFRTPNDAFMTGNFHVATSLLQKVLKLDALAWFQLVLAATYSGAFHPDRRGSGGDRRCRRAQGAWRAGEVRAGAGAGTAGRRHRGAVDFRRIAVGACLFRRCLRGPRGEPAIDVGERAHATSRAFSPGPCPCP